MNDPMSFNRFMTSIINFEIIMDNFYILLAICILTHIVRSVYEIMKTKKIISAGNKIIFMIIFTDMALLWFSWFQMCELDPWQLPIPGFIQLAGFVLSAVGLFMFFVVLFKLRTLENYKGELVKDGIFRYLRHPMYLAFIFWLFGFAAFKCSGLSLIFAVPFTLNILFWRSNEEKDLERRYPEYKEYKKQTYF